MKFFIQTKRESQKKMKTGKTFLMPFIVVYLIVITGCACLTPSPIPTTVREVRPGILQGYLPIDKAPNSLTLLPAPPAKESAAFAADQDAFVTTRSLINTPRWTQAIKDRQSRFSRIAAIFFLRA